MMSLFCSTLKSSGDRKDDNGKLFSNIYYSDNKLFVLLGISPVYSQSGSIKENNNNTVQHNAIIKTSLVGVIEQSVVEDLKRKEIAPTVSKRSYNIIATPSVSFKNNKKASLSAAIESKLKKNVNSKETATLANEKTVQNKDIISSSAISNTFKPTKKMFLSVVKFSSASKSHSNTIEMRIKSTTSRKISSSSSYLKSSPNNSNEAFMLQTTPVTLTSASIKASTSYDNKILATSGKSFMTSQFVIAPSFAVQHHKTDRTVLNKIYMSTQRTPSLLSSMHDSLSSSTINQYDAVPSEDVKTVTDVKYTNKLTSVAATTSYQQKEMSSSLGSTILADLETVLTKQTELQTPSSTVIITSSAITQVTSHYFTSSIIIGKFATASSYMMSNNAFSTTSKSTTSIQLSRDKTTTLTSSTQILKAFSSVYLMSSSYTKLPSFKTFSSISSFPLSSNAKAILRTSSRTSSSYFVKANQSTKIQSSTVSSSKHIAVSVPPPTTPPTTPKNSTSTTTEFITSLPTTEESFTNQPGIKTLPSLLDKTTGTTLKIQIYIPYDHTEVKHVYILVQEFKDGVSDSASVSTWFNVNNRPAHRFRRYRAVEIPHLKKSVKNLNHDETKRMKREVVNNNDGMHAASIGIDLKCDVKPKYVCNGPLKPGTSYRFQVEAELFNKSIYHSQFTEAHTTYKETINTKIAGPNTTILIVLSVLLVCFVLLSLIITIVVCRRRQRGRSLRGDSTDDVRSALMHSSQKSSKHSRRKFAGPDILMERRKSIKGMTRPVSVRDFRAWVLRSSSDSDFRFAEEFESMRDVGKFERHEVADMPENRGKNRYVNVLAYDYTRVKLTSIDDEPGSDYINANYVHGYKRPRAYIASQGPLPSTTDDFWRMTWEQNSRIIVMVTQCMERGRVKCHEYWPTTESTRFGEIVVTQLSEYEASEWIEREFLLEFEGETRNLRHYQFIAWPDHGVPKSTTAMLDFIHTIRLQQQPEDGPLICHCSAGVGRTGTYLCLDILMNKLHYEYNVDAYGVVCLMRTQRCSMVQTEDQYIFIHRVMLEYLQQKEDKQQIFSTLTRPTNGQTPVVFTTNGDDDHPDSDAFLDEDEQLNEKLVERTEFSTDIDDELHSSQNSVCETST